MSQPIDDQLPPTAFDSSLDLPGDGDGAGAAASSSEELLRTLPTRHSIILQSPLPSTGPRSTGGMEASAELPDASVSVGAKTRDFGFGPAFAATKIDPPEDPSDDSLGDAPNRRPLFGEEADEAERLVESSLAAGEKPPEFVLTRLIGEGGQGQVWSAWQTSLGREVAVKKLVGNDAEAFLREAHVSATLDHPNIVPVHDLGRVRDDFGSVHPILAMKLARGVPWDRLIDADRERTNFALDAFLARHLPILLDVCEAVRFAHSKGIVHRDLKPHQVIVGEFGETYLMDWGMAVSAWDEDPDADRRPGGAASWRRHTPKTAANQCGTPAYMAPEQTLATAEKVGFHTDVYLLGAILFELISGEPPHAARDISEAYQKARQNALAPLPQEAPTELAAIALKALATNPAKRHRDAGEFHRELTDRLNGSGQRRESKTIVRDSMAALDEAAAGRGVATLDHQRLIQMERDLERALRLWPGNRDAHEARERLLALHADLAADANDLGFAESLALQIAENDARRSIILGRVAAKRKRQRRDGSQRRVFLAVCVALLTLLAAASIWFLFEREVAGEKLLAEFDRAEAARADAEKQRRAAEREIGESSHRVASSLERERDALEAALGAAAAADREVRAGLLARLAANHAEAGRLEEGRGALAEALALGYDRAKGPASIADALAKLDPAPAPARS
jgi:serine/threonine protein kinase